MDTGVSTQFDRVVFQATREIFVGEKSKTRKVKGVKRCISEHPGDRSSVLQLVTQHGAGTVHQSILRLLSDKVYESNLIASQRFPDLLESSVAQSEARTLLEEQATRTEQPALENILQTYGDDSQENSEWTEATTVLNDINDVIARNDVGNSSVLPVYLPFPAEHMLMEKIQKTLELACYQFGLRALPNVMQKQGWDCPESVELSKWAKLFGRKGNLVWEGSNKPSKELLQSIAAIRHTAVHRLRTNSEGLERFLADAENLAGVLGDDTFTQAISQLRLDTQTTLIDLIRNKQFIQLQLEKAQEDIARQRAELNQKEQEILLRMASEDRKYRDQAGERLERALGRMGDLRVASIGQDAVLESVDDILYDPLSDDDSDFDYEEQFEDCSEA
ncbi:hypothetical protein BFJ63_vAg14726 [Fusarium oxysporum f. sp. narcissi]|uniref:Uncharacterized protein n=1 Tax=Fusarium oxysporum f. sp. narcissi TaxID=451672 RepID=A0A4V1RYQ0_FUSOX|nr:hypothetical protein BFJ71_g13499 [Fusarium oxysporum]RYC82376.1 hypothetical protein BFJ63_vAg14726 [Fusarium oxysporum f. sp. narcissi]